VTEKEKVANAFLVMMYMPEAIQYAKGWRRKEIPTFVPIKRIRRNDPYSGKE
jgi:hypothetical protein